MKKMFMIVSIMVGIFAMAEVAMADEVGVNYSVTKPTNFGSVSDSAYEVNYVHVSPKFVDIVGRLEVTNDHSTSGYGNSLAVGTNFTFGKGNVVPFVQPLVTYTSPEVGGSYLGYEVAAGVDFNLGSVTITPAYTYSNDFGSRKVSQQSASVGVKYALTKVWSLDAKYRRDYNEVGANDVRYVGGVSYKF